MPMTLATRTSLIAIPRQVWKGEALEDIAGVALAIERRMKNRVLLPKEGGRYPLVCERLSDLARSLAQTGDANVVWDADGEETALWIGFTRELYLWAKEVPGDPRLLRGVWRLRSTFVPPDQLGDVIFSLDKLIEKHLSSWSGGERLQLLLKRRGDACRCAEGSGTVECLTLYPAEYPK